MANQSNVLFAALADPTRAAVIDRLCAGPAAVGELHAPHDMALPTFLKHLKVLERAGLVRSEKQGRVRTVSLEPRALATAEDWIRERRQAWERRFDRLDTLVQEIERKKGRNR